MIKRELEKKLLQLASQFPAVSVTGPRQSGKTTLIRNLFPEKRYYSLEDPDIRLMAMNDPRHLLESSDSGYIFDEVQRVPSLFSYLQSAIDSSGKPGEFILSGSQSFLLSNKISQTLAGRVAVLKLLPLSMSELCSANLESQSLDSVLFTGGYPAIYDRGIDPADFFPSYIQTYVERDVRQLQNIRHLDEFIRFVRLCAGRIGQLLNVTSLASDCGVSVNTAKSWISMLEAGYILFRLRPHYKNFSKRLVKMPKLYFYDTGLACYLLNIDSVTQLENHYIRGSLFENMIITEFLKKRWNQGRESNLYFWRDNKGVELDCLIEKGIELVAVEIKSGKTIAVDFWKGIKYWQAISGASADNSYLIYAGNENLRQESGNILSWKKLKVLLDRI
ncbi:ATP-binding protein [bacterium]|nr:ATP-binding protein [bacterium]